MTNPAHPLNMSLTFQSRRPAGVPVGGQFAVTARDETSLTLTPDVDPDELTPTGEQKFCSEVDALAAFHNANDRKPSAAAADPEERRLGYLLTRIRRTFRGEERGRTTLERLEYLDATVPWWSDGMERLELPDMSVGEGSVPLSDPVLGYDQEANFTKKVDELAAFCASNGRAPSWRATDQTERALVQFLLRIRETARGQGDYRWTPERKAYLDRVAPWWSDDLDTDDARERKFRAQADALAVLRATHGLAPDRRSSDVEEKRLGGFLDRLRTQARGGRSADLLTPVRRAYLDQVTPWWSTADARDRAFRTSVDQLVEFNRAHGRKPNSKSSDPVEARLARMLIKGRMAARRNATGENTDEWTAERLRYFDEVAPWWSDGLDADGKEWRDDPAV